MRRILTFTAIVALAFRLSADDLQESIRTVERIRGIQFRGPVKTVTISRADLPRHLREQIVRSMPYSFDEYMVILQSLRLVTPETKGGEKMLLDLLQQQVLAFYDPQAHIYYSIDTPPDQVKNLPAMPGFEQAVVVHELMHALQDQRFSAGKTTHERRKDWDAAMALHSVLEGEASLVMLASILEPLGQKLETIAANRQLVEAIGGAAALMSGDTTGMPRYFTESLAAPYTAGLRFVLEAYRRGGWAAVDAVYANPPRSMREILHPADYFARRLTTKADALVPPVPVNGLLSVERLGEWHWEFLVGKDAATGWVSDRVSIAQDSSCQPTVLVETRWESERDARAFRDAYSAFLEKEKVEAEVRLDGTRVDVAYGADPALMQRFLERAL